MRAMESFPGRLSSVASAVKADADANAAITDAASKVRIAFLDEKIGLFTWGTLPDLCELTTLWVLTKS